MRYAEIVFNKKLDEIGLDDLRNFFSTEKEETSRIEFKSGEIKIEDIYPEISAFLNTDGGVLIIGSPRETKKTINKKTQKKICQGELVPSKFQNKGWLTQKIAAFISPFPLNIEIREIITSEGNYFILDIPQSMSPPHQCSNEGRYYIRLEDEARPAPHGIVQSLFLKRQQPIISAKVKLTTYKGLEENKIEIRINITNNSKFPAENISFLVKIRNIIEIEVGEMHENSQGFSEKGKDAFQLQNTVNQVFVEKLAIPIDFYVLHKSQPFIISIMIWGKDFELYENHCIWDPVKFEKVIGYKSGDSVVLSLIDLDDKLKEMLDTKD